MRILAVGAHPDDFELGCGGSLALFKQLGHQVNGLVLTRGEASGDPIVRENEARRASALIGLDNLSFGNLTDTRIADGIDTIHTIENEIDAFAPDFVFTHSIKDSHQDHRNTHLATISAARRVSRVLLYESPAALRDFYPQAFIDINSTFQIKLSAIAAFDSQSTKTYINAQPSSSDPCSTCERNGQVSNAAAGLARFRGFQAGVGLAEAFEVAKYLIDTQMFQATSSREADTAKVGPGRISPCVSIQPSVS